MLTLFTAAPGGGKTASMIDQAMREVGDRPIFAAGIEGLKLPHTALDPLRWHEEVPDGAVMLIDEVQQWWRPRHAGSGVPPEIQALEVHRHRGIDVYMTTQGPNLLHANVRALVGRHVHLRDLGVLGRWWYEWPECCDNPRERWRSSVLKKRFTLPKRTFQHYKSASLHVKPVRGFPRALIVVAIAVAGCAFLGWRIFSSVAARVAPPEKAAPAPVSTQEAAALPTPAGPSQFDARSYRAQWVPRVADVPESASAYDHLRMVTVMPRIIGGWCQGDICKCLTQQGTRAPVSDRACKRWHQDRPFDPYRVEQGAQPQQRMANAVQQPELAASAPF